jgi:hypothetical protein
MSTPHGSAQARVGDVLRAKTSLSLDVRGDLAETIVNAVHPKIVDAIQMRGVPEGSILIDEPPSPRLIYTWDGTDLHMLVVGGSGGSFAPAYIIKDWGPLTVVWMP